jgi:valyl-tRNA synthetase
LTSTARLRSPGTDTAYDTGQMKIGRRLAIKLLNASKFVLTVFPATGFPATGFPATGGEPDTDATVTEPLDRAMLAELAETVQAATDWFEAYDYARALERTEEFFWNFCDNYLELVKDRAYGEDPGRDPSGTASARAALRLALSAIVRLFAPFLPFATEEVWSWWQEGSVHRAAWPDPAELGSAADSDREVLAVASDVIATVRKAKSEAKLSMRTEVSRVEIAASTAVLDRVLLAEGDLRAAGRISIIEQTPAQDGDLRVTVSL